MLNHELTIKGGFPRQKTLADDLRRLLAANGALFFQDFFTKKEKKEAAIEKKAICTPVTFELTNRADTLVPVSTGPLTCPVMLHTDLATQEDILTFMHSGLECSMSKLYEYLTRLGKRLTLTISFSPLACLRGGLEARIAEDASDVAADLELHLFISS